MPSNTNQIPRNDRRTEKDMVDPAELDAIVDMYENKVGPRNGARVVARAWVDPVYKRRLRERPSEAIAEFGFEGPQQEHLEVVENEPKVHNLVVCTLCSCYPWSTLGLPPVWYKSAPYRSRAMNSSRLARRSKMSLSNTPESEPSVDRDARIRAVSAPRCSASK